MTKRGTVKVEAGNRYIDIGSLKENRPVSRTGQNINSIGIADYRIYDGERKSSRCKTWSQLKAYNRPRITHKGGVVGRIPDNPELIARNHFGLQGLAIGPGGIKGRRVLNVRKAPRNGHIQLECREEIRIIDGNLHREKLVRPHYMGA